MSWPGRSRRSYGAAFAANKDLEQEVLVSQKDKTYRPIKRRLISNVLRINCGICLPDKGEILQPLPD